MKQWLFIFFISLLAACAPASRTPTKEEKQQELIEADTLHLYDVLHLNGKAISFLPAAPEDFENLSDKGYTPENPNNDSLLFIRDKPFISKKDSVITILCRAGKVSLTEHNKTDGEGYLDYKYAGGLKDNPTAVFSEGYNLGLDYLLINAHSGKQNKLWGIPQLSPGGKMVISASYDLDAGFMHNGIQVFAVEVDSLRLIWQQEFELWGPAQVKWADAHNIVIKQVCPGTETGKDIVSYAKVKLD